MSDLTPRQKLWNFFVDNHDLHLLDSELNEIMIGVGKTIEEEKKWRVIESDGGCHLDMNGHQVWFSDVKNARVVVATHNGE